MNYELCKQLEEAGYPQERGEGNWAHPKRIESETVVGVYRPTLEELIGACSEYIEAQKFTIICYSSGWWAGYTGVGDYNRPEMGRGATPAEAVANLWLALTKSK